MHICICMYTNTFVCICICIFVWYLYVKLSTYWEKMAYSLSGKEEGCEEPAGGRRGEGPWGEQNPRAPHWDAGSAETWALPWAPPALTTHSPACARATRLVRKQPHHGPTVKDRARNWPLEATQLWPPSLPAQEACSALVPMCSHLGSLLQATLQPPGATDTSLTFACLSPAQTSALRSKDATPGASPDSQTRGAPLLPSGAHVETWEGTLMGVEELGAGWGSCLPTAVLGPRPNLWTGKTALSPLCPEGEEPASACSPTSHL